MNVWNDLIDTSGRDLVSAFQYLIMGAVCDGSIC